MISFLRGLAASRFARNVAIVTTGAAGAQAITMAFSPAIARLYGPEAFGALGTYTAILTVLAPLAAMNYPIAIVLPRQDRDAIKLAKLSLGIAVVTSLLAASLIAFFKSPIVNAFNLEPIEPYILFLPIAMFLSTLMAVMVQWVIRKHLFRVNARVAFLQAFFLNAAKAVGGIFSPTAALLIILTTLGAGLHALLLWLGVRKTSLGEANQVKPSKVKPPSAKELAWQHRDFVYYRTPQTVLNAVSQSMPVLLLAAFFGPSSAGFYSLGRLALGAPSALVGQSVASVFYPRINEAVQRGENAFALLVRATVALAAFGIGPFAVVVAAGPWLFSWIFGDEWRTAGVYAQWLALWAYFAFINRPSVATIPVLALQGHFLAFEVGSVVLRSVALAVGFFVFRNALTAVALFSVVSAVLNIALVAATASAASKVRPSDKLRL